MEYSIDKQRLWDILEEWDLYVPRKIHLIACGGTALTIQNVKESTRDVDFMVPAEEEYSALIETLKRLDYREQTGTGWSKGDGFIFDLFRGKNVFTTELLESPLQEGNNLPIRSFVRIYVGALNDYDLVISKIFRASPVDIKDCLDLIHSRGDSFDFAKFEERYKETAKYEIHTERMLKNLEGFLRRLKQNKP